VQRLAPGRYVWLRPRARSVGRRPAPARPRRTAVRRGRDRVRVPRRPARRGGACSCRVHCVMHGRAHRHSPRLNLSRLGAAAARPRAGLRVGAHALWRTEEGPGSCCRVVLCPLPLATAAPRAASSPLMFSPAGLRALTQCSVRHDGRGQHARWRLRVNVFERSLRRRA
jgi:hypothetical protein